MTKDLDLLRLAQSITKPGTPEPIEFRYGVIGSISSGPPATVGVFIAGAPQETLGLYFLSSYAPAVSDVVVMAKAGADLWVLGTFGESSGPGLGLSGHGPKNGRGLYTLWTWAEPAGSFGAYDVLMRIDDGPFPSEPDPSYFFSHQYSYVGGGIAYVGLQFNGLSGARNQLIWSVWNSIPASVAAFAVVGGHAGTPPADLAVSAHPFGGEGIGQTINMGNAWTHGHEHRMRLYSLGDDGHGDGSHWFLLYFADLTADWEVQVGKICNAPGNGFIAATGSSSFFEPYGGPKNRPEEFPYACAVLHKPVGNPFDAETFPATSRVSWEWGMNDTWPVGRIQACGAEANSDVRHEFGIYSI